MCGVAALFKMCFLLLSFSQAQPFAGAGSRVQSSHGSQPARLAVLQQPGRPFLRSDNQLEMKATLPLKVVAAGRLSEPECALQRCPASAHGCDFEMKHALTLKVIEDGEVQGAEEVAR